MARRIFEFVCKEGHLSDKLVDSDCRATHCPICDQPAERIISTPMVKLEGVTGDFPGAAMQWERKRAEKIKAEQKSAANA
jgi:hypothetical protein